MGTKWNKKTLSEKLADLEFKETNGYRTKDARKLEAFTHCWAWYELPWADMLLRTEIKKNEDTGETYGAEIIPPAPAKGQPAHPILVNARIRAVQEEILVEVEKFHENALASKKVHDSLKDVERIYLSFRSMVYTKVRQEQNSIADKALYKAGIKR